MLNMCEYHRCGTPACAVGEAATMAHFRAMGMELVRSGGLRYAECEGHGKISDEIFGLSHPQRQRIFGGDYWNAWKSNDVSPRDWAIEARKVLAENGYTMDAPVDPFKRFMDKVREPVSLGSYAASHR